MTFETNITCNKNKNFAAWLSVGVFGGLATCLVTIAWPFIIPAFRNVVLPYVPATSVQVENVLKAIRYRRSFDPDPENPKLIDLGSGDGRIVISCAQQGFRSHGVELNPWLVIYSKYRAFRENVYEMVSFRWKNLFKVDLAEYDKVIIFGVENMMSLIEEKARQDCNKANKHITLITCRFPLPHWKPFMTFGAGVDQVWLYKYYPSHHVSKSKPKH